MKKIIFTIMIVVLFSAQSFSQSIDEILNSYYEAAGQEILASKNTYKISMVIEQGGMEIPLTVIGKRPGMIRSEVNFQGIKQITTFDGNEGWTINPFMGMTEPQKVDENQILQLKDQADIDGDLVNYKSKNNKLELLNENRLDGKSVFAIKVTKPTGDINIHYLDEENFLIIKTVTRSAQNPNDSLITDLMDYKPIDGVWFPHKVDVHSGGKNIMKTRLISVEFDVEAPDSLFGKPVLDK